jgi:hypothetical protein
MTVGGVRLMKMHASCPGFPYGGHKEHSSQTLYSKHSLILLQLFATGVVEKGGKFAAGVVDTADSLSLGSLTPAANLLPVSLTSEANLPTVSTTPVVLVEKFTSGVIDAGGAP